MKTAAARSELPDLLARLLGRAAARNGDRSDTCPFAFKTPQCWAWREGWIEIALKEAFEE